MSSHIFDRLSFLSLFLSIVLLPVFCLPFTKIPVETSKGLLVVLGLAFTIVFWAIARFFDGKIVLPRSWFLVSGFGIVLTSFLSALVSRASTVSFFGTMFDTGSFWFVFAGFLLLLMSSVIVRTPLKAKLILLGLILASALVFIFQIAHLVWPLYFSLGILPAKTSNILGSWNALGVFAGFSCLVLLLQVGFFPVRKVGKILLQILILLSIFVAAVVNFPLMWILLGISSLIIFVYKASSSFLKKDDAGRKHFPAFSFIVVLVCLFFFISGQFMGNIIPRYFGISNAEIGPSFGATYLVTKSVLSDHPVFGIGPNRFGEAWALYKPVSINNTQFWDVTFDSGSGLLPTLLSTVGGFGILAWVVFLAMFLTAGVRSVFGNIKNSASSDMAAFFVVSLYLFVSMFFYAAGAVIFLLAFAFAGMFIGLSASGGSRDVTFSFLEDHRKSFFSILGLIILVIFSVAATFKFVERFTSVFYFGKALSATAIPEAEQSIGKALSLYTNDLYLRTYSQVYQVKLNSLANKGSGLTEEEKADLQASFDQAISGAQAAVAFNPSNYLNHRLLGSLYQTAGVLGVKDAYTRAVEAYQRAEALNPANPGLKIAISSALYADGKQEEAIQYTEKALALAPADKSIIAYLDSLRNKKFTPIEPAPAEPNQ